MTDNGTPVARPSRPGGSWAVFLIRALTTLLAIIAIMSLVASIQLARGVPRPLTVTACTPEDFVDGAVIDGEIVEALLSCDGAAPPDPDVLVLTEDLVIPVSGRLTLNAPESVAYNIRVEWVHIASGTRITAIETPIVYEPGTNNIYGSPWDPFGWAPPPQLVTAAERASPGESLGEWRIVGTAEPVNPDQARTYIWDSVETFELVAP